ncbi:MAG: two-component system response regulator [Deltaproteobacteria bacterium CG2_30_66_27]|nr:MAG: two-component system response regulator [Deltaproteobacteria bacterium CG2_30_66_27]PJB32516.1 MAG: two-component system response regulator [Deltaproteobacteria bacterium CG_4_9_14_3_um_filter_65_9]
MKILVVDDDRTTRKMLSLYLKGNGFDIVTAENGLDAIEKLGDGTVNLVVTDLNMPYMDGIEFIRTMKTNPDTGHIPALMITTEDDGEERKRAAAAGADGYLVKPVTSDTVVLKVRQLLADIFRKGRMNNA